MATEILPLPTVFTAYRITCTLNGKVYIGITRRSLRARWLDHTEKTGITTKLNSAIRKHGKQNFIIEPIAQSVNWKDLNELERVLVAQYDSFNNGYNATTGGEGGPPVFSQASRDKMSLSHRGKKQSPELIAKRTAKLIGRTGWKRSPEQRAAQSLRAKQFRWTPERRIHMSNIFKGRVFTPEWKAKISQAKKDRGQGPSPEQSAAHSLKMKGRKKPPRSDEYRRNISIAITKWHAAGRPSKKKPADLFP